MLFTLAAPMTTRSLFAQPAGGSETTGIVWQWQHTVSSTDFVAPNDSSRYTLELLSDGTAAVRADCNRGSGRYQVTGNQITIGPLATTLAACPPGSLDSEFLRQLNDAAMYATDGARLYIGLKTDAATMTFMNPAGEQAAVTGVVTYLQRIALPPDSVITVRLEDSSRADAPAIVLGEQVIETMGRQVPIPFSIPYDPADIDPRGRYTLRARIEDADGRLRWINMQSIPVITGGNPTTDVEVLVQPVG
jgi:uncharacterized lipoprotein YbaY